MAVQALSVHLHRDGQLTSQGGDQTFSIALRVKGPQGCPLKHQWQAAGQACSGYNHKASYIQENLNTNLTTIQN